MPHKAVAAKTHKDCVSLASAKICNVKWMKNSLSLLQVEKLKIEVSKRSNDQQRRAKEKMVAVKRMQDLERQVYDTNTLRNSTTSVPLLLHVTEFCLFPR